MWTLPTWERPTDWDEAAPSTTLRKPPKGIEPSTSPLPRVCSTTELRWHDVQTEIIQLLSHSPASLAFARTRGARQSGRSCSHTQPERVRSSVIRRHDLHDLVGEERPMKNRARGHGGTGSLASRALGARGRALSRASFPRSRAWRTGRSDARQRLPTVRRGPCQGLVKNVLRSRPKTRTPLSTSSSRRLSHSGTLSTWPSRKRQRA